MSIPISRRLTGKQLLSNFRYFTLLTDTRDQTLSDNYEEPVNSHTIILDVQNTLTISVHSTEMITHDGIGSASQDADTRNVRIVEGSQSVSQDVGEQPMYDSTLLAEWRPPRGLTRGETEPGHDSRLLKRMDHTRHGLCGSFTETKHIQLWYGDGFRNINCSRCKKMSRSTLALLPWYGMA